jgi:putative phage-type endonuclease
MTCERIEMEQGSAEWHALRKNKITATDAPIIMGVSPWKSRFQLYHEKLSPTKQLTINDRMQRGTELEPIARDLFNIQSGFLLVPGIVVRDWAMASLDGISDDGRTIVEIKCPGEKDHALALEGKIPDKYYPQLQHQMYVAGVNSMYYFSFDGLDGVYTLVKRDDEYIEKMIIEEKKLYDCLINKTPPEKDENDYIERDDDLWKQCASRWISINTSLRELEKEEERLRQQLILLSGESNSKGAGISLCQIKRKGNIEYSKIPQLKSVDLEIYRKPSIDSWRLVSNLV